MGRDRTKLHPRLRELAAEFEAKCHAAGLNVLITECFRTVEEQNEKYAQGRTTPGIIITNCKGTDYQSPHQWGVAFDFCRNVHGSEYSDHDNFFAQCGEIGKSLGLFWGGDFRGFVDKPHLEWPESLPNNSTYTLRQKYGVPEKYILTWGDYVTYDLFKVYMEMYNAELAAQPIPEWAVDELKEAIDLGITDGTHPMQLIPRYQAAIMAKRAKLGGNDEV